MKYPRDVHCRMRSGRFGVLKALSDWEDTHRCSASLAILGEIIGCSRQSVYQHLQRLMADGLVDKEFRGRYITNRAGRRYLREVGK